MNQEQNKTEESKTSEQVDESMEKKEFEMPKPNREIEPAQQDKAEQKIEIPKPDEIKEPQDNNQNVQEGPAEEYQEEIEEAVEKQQEPDVEEEKEEPDNAKRMSDIKKEILTLEWDEKRNQINAAKKVKLNTLREELKKLEGKNENNTKTD
jgi:hypothetical protein